jgi:type I restriction enzyme S subunit
LDKNVKLKESEYVFPVNENWKRYRLKDLGFLYSGLSGKAGDDFNQDDNPNNKGFIPFTNIANNIYLDTKQVGSVVMAENEKQNKVRKGDLFFLMSSEGYEDVGKTAALAEEMKDTYLNSFCKGYRITKNFCEPFFLNYLLLSDNYRKSLITEGKGFTRINLKMEKVTDFFVYLPPTKVEQTTIANYLDEKTQKIDAIVSNIGKQIDTLKELRKTLINDVVTGKIKVITNGNK